jgi:hypothetical protein
VLRPLQAHDVIAPFGGVHAGRPLQSRKAISAKTQGADRVDENGGAGGQVHAIVGLVCSRISRTCDGKTLVAPRSR